MLSDVGRFVMPKGALELAREYLRPPGTRGHEAFVLFAGRIFGGEATVETVFFPPQKPIVGGGGGVGVYVSGQSLFEVTRVAIKNGQTLLGQMHTHPGAAYHSDTDDTYPLVSLPGAFSVVVPFFARRPIELVECACYRVTARDWQAISAISLFRVV